MILLVIALATRPSFFTPPSPQIGDNPQAGQSLPVQRIAVDTTSHTPISPYIYGVNYPDTWIQEWLPEWEHYHEPFTLARCGGNRFTAYNWETNASNAGNDYFHENDDYLGMSNDPGWTVESFVRYVQREGAAALVTVPILGYVSADKTTQMNGSRDVGKTPDYLNVRFNKSYARKPGGKLTYPPDTGDKSVYQDEFVAWLESIKSPNSPVFYSLDNEPDLWSQTHARVEPHKTTYDEIIGKNIEYAAMIKSVAPSALVFGPVNYGWQGMRTFQNAPDANGRDFVDAYLDGLQIASKKAGKRLVDVYDFHYYPENMGGGVRITFSPTAGNAETFSARIQAPRSLWDPTFVENTWITKSLGGKPMMLLPRMRAKVDKHYPGTKLAITEYDFGGRQTVSGMLAQADALGVFGRFGLFAACHWGVTHIDAPAYAAFEAFRDYDRHGSRFGDQSLPVQGETPSENSVYASLDSGNRRRLTLVAINKNSRASPFVISLKGFDGRAIRSYVRSDGVYSNPLPGDARIENREIKLTAPPLSVVSCEVMK